MTELPDDLARLHEEYVADRMEPHRGRDKYCIVLECFGELDHELIEKVRTLANDSKVNPIIVGTPHYIIHHLAMRHIGGLEFTAGQIQDAITEMVDNG